MLKTFQIYSVSKLKSHPCLKFSGLLFLIFAIFNSCTSGQQGEQTSLDDTAQTENVNSYEIILPNAQQEFVAAKIQQFTNAISEEETATVIESKASGITSEHMRMMNSQLEGWVGKIISVDMFQGENLDIAISILDQNLVGERIVVKNDKEHVFESGITIEASQADSPSSGQVGLKREGELYETVMSLEPGDIVVFDAEVLNATDNTEKTGVNLSTLLSVNITDIHKK